MRQKCRVILQMIKIFAITSRLNSSLWIKQCTIHITNWTYSKFPSETYLMNSRYGLKWFTSASIFSWSPKAKKGIRRIRACRTLLLARTNGLLMRSSSMISWSLSPHSFENSWRHNYNKLTQDIRDTEAISHFRRKLTTHLFTVI